MSSNFEWQKRQANERVQLRLHEAAEHRRVRQGRGRTSFSNVVRIIIPTLVGLVVAIWLLTGCASTSGTEAEAEMNAAGVEALSMADHIHFQDKLEANLEVGTTFSDAAALKMAARIRFQDKRESYLEERAALQTQPIWTMADRIRFHDGIVSDFQ
jgi:hypothetical protein